MDPFISREDLKTLMDSGSGYTLVEALPQKYYQAEHLPGAINIPHDEVDASASRLIPDKNSDVVVYCANAACQNSHLAAETLRALGYRRVYQYVEGKQGWKEAGLPLDIAAGEQ